MLDMTKDQRTILNQQEQIDVLLEQVRQLKSSLVPVVMFPIEWKLSAGRARMLASLYSARTGFLTHDQLFLALSNTGESTDVLGLVRTQVSLLKTHLKKVGVAIEIVTRWGSGYELTASSKAIIKEALERRAEG